MAATLPICEVMARSRIGISSLREPVETKSTAFTCGRSSIQGMIHLHPSPPEEGDDRLLGPPGWLRRLAGRPSRLARAGHEPQRVAVVDDGSSSIVRREAYSWDEI